MLDYTVHPGPLQDDLRLTPTSFIVLGLLELAGEATPYQLKQSAGRSVGSFWTLQHAQLYSEPERLAAAGYLSERREEGGRRRRRYRLTARGRRALERWRSEPTSDLAELREPALLKLFFGADPKALARAQVQAHERELREYLEWQRRDPGSGPRGPWLALDAGIGHAREWLRFWRRLAKG